MRTAVRSEKKLPVDILVTKKYTVVLFFLSPTNLPTQVLVITIDSPILLQRIFSNLTLAGIIPPSPNFYA